MYKKNKMHYLKNNKKLEYCIEILKERFLLNNIFWIIVGILLSKFIEKF